MLGEKMKMKLPPQEEGEKGQEHDHRLAHG